ncbi:MAG TPA: GntR family transcriptional regulator [Sphingobacteriaceae bacterium]|nr:GntR family transcriptional regulator [Sphingobacteriaceae bacterium]
MEFRDNEAIYLQIANSVSEYILLGKWKIDDKIPSVRDLAAEMQVNPNTVIRTYEFLQNKEIIYTKRGLGFFVGGKAVEKIKKYKKEQFLETALPGVFRDMYLLDIGIEDITKRYETFKSKYLS